jgi:hypothetical protein
MQRGRRSNAPASADHGSQRNASIAIAVSIGRVTMNRWPLSIICSRAFGMSRARMQPLTDGTRGSSRPISTRVGCREHVLLRNADAPAARGDLALLHARDQKRREAYVAVVRELALPPDVLVAGREVHSRRGCQWPPGESASAARTSVSAQIWLTPLSKSQH